MEARELQRMSFEDYVALEQTSDERWEYVNGEAWVMGGASVAHNVVCSNVLVALRAALGGRRCLVLPEGQKIATPATRGYHYADASVVCGPIARDERDAHAIVNPVVIVEVASPSTADYDRGGKLRHYRTLRSFREYVVIDPIERIVEHQQRLETGQWLVTELSEGSLELSSIEARIELSDLWVDLELAEPAKSSEQPQS